MACSAHGWAWTDAVATPQDSSPQARQALALSWTRRHTSAYTDSGSCRSGIEQAQALLEVAWDDRHFALYALGLVIPSRLGELLGLAWPNIDFDNGIIHFRQSTKPASKNNKGEIEPMTLGALKIHGPAGRCWFPIGSCRS